MLQGLIEVRRLHRSSTRPSQVAPLAQYVLEGAWEWLDDPPPDTGWGERVRPSLRLGTRLGQGPELLFPAGLTQWHLNSEPFSYGSGNQETTQALPFSATGKWSVSGQVHDGRRIDATFGSAFKNSVVLLFDERNRYHHHALNLGGLRASVVAPTGSTVTGSIDRQPLIDSWSGYDRIEVALGGESVLLITAPDASSVSVNLEASLGAELAGEVVEELRGPNGERVMSGPPRIVFTGHVPPANEVQVSVHDEQGQRDLYLDDPLIVVEDGVYKLGQLFDPNSVSVLTVTLRREGLDPFVEGIIRIPGIGVAPVPLTDMNSSSELEVSLLEGFVTEPELLAAEPNAQEFPFLVGSPDGSWVEVVVLLPRLMWDAYRDAQQVLLTSQKLRLGSEEISALTLKLRTGVSSQLSVGLESPDGKVLQRTDEVATRGAWAILDVSLGQFVDTVNYASAAPRLDLAVMSPHGRVLVGVIETRYVPDDLQIQSDLTDDGCILELEWEEFRPTKERVARVWGGLGEGLILESPIPDGALVHTVEVDGIDYGELLVGIFVNDEWATEVSLNVPPNLSDCVTIRLEGGTFGELVAHLATGERLQLTTFDLEHYSRELASFFQKTAGTQPSDERYVARLLGLIGEYGERILAVSLELADLLGVDPDDPTEFGSESVERRLLPLLLFATDAPIELASPATDDALERLWATAPILAATLDQFDQEDAPEANNRWIRYTGWEPPGHGVGVNQSFERLVCPLYGCLSSIPQSEALDQGLLSSAGWAAAVSREKQLLDQWFLSSAKSNSTWIIDKDRQVNLQLLWDFNENHGTSRSLVHLVGTAVLAFDPGPHSEQALKLLEVAHSAAPLSTRCAVAFGVANARLQARYQALQLVHPNCRRMKNL